MCNRPAMNDLEFTERMDIMIVDGEMPKWHALDATIHRYEDCGQKCVPERWKYLNARWRANVKELYPEQQQDAHKALKIKHSVGSFTELTIGQIWESVKKMEKKLNL